MAALKQKLAAARSPSGYRWRYRPPLTGDPVPRNSKTALVGQTGSYDVPTRNGGRYVVRWAGFTGRTVEYVPPA